MFSRNSIQLIKKRFTSINHKSNFSFSNHIENRIINQVPQALKIRKFIDDEWEKCLPTFIRILSIPSQSRNFDPEFLTNGLIQKTVHHFKNWILNQNIQGLKCEYYQDPGLSPFLYVEIEGNTSEQTVLFYGHMDKQPPFEGWAEGLSPYNPVIKDGKLYARGANDDHYSVFASILAVKGCQTLGYKHPRVVMIFETDEESGSTDIIHYLEKLKDRIGNQLQIKDIFQIGRVDLVFCIDAFAPNEDTLWLTSTLRGVLSAVVSVKVLKEGVHSGEASGIVPSSFRIMRQLLDRIEDNKTGQIIDKFQVTIPGESYLEAFKAAQILGNKILQQYPYINDQFQPVTNDYVTGYLNKIWRAQLSVVGADCLPKTDFAGNVLRPETKLKLSLRLPPTKNPKEAEQTFINILTTNVPYNAVVEISQMQVCQGFLAPQLQPEIDQALKDASKLYFNKEMLKIGAGGSIPLMNLLQEKYPSSQLIITGAVLPNGGAHGPNEFLPIDYTKKLMCCITYTLSRLMQ